MGWGGYAQPMTDEIRALLTDFANLLGLPDRAAAAFGAIYAAESPLSLDDLVEQTGLSKSVMSIATRELLRLNVVESREGPQAAHGLRKHYAPRVDLGQAVLSVLYDQRQIALGRLRERAESSLAQTGSEQAGQALIAVQSALALAEFLSARPIEAWWLELQHLLDQGSKV